MDAAGLAIATANLAAENIDAACITCDVGDRQQVDAAVAAAVQTFGTLDIAVCNAGIVRTADFLDLTEDDWDDVVRVNLKGVFLTGQAAARQMVAQKSGGAIVNMSSVNAVMAIPTLASYNASKGGINTLTRCMSLSLAKHGIRVNAVGPGSIMTEMLQQVATNKEVMENILSRTPLLRVGDPMEVGNVVKFLANSDESSYMTGQILYVDGGRQALNYTVAVPDDVLEAATAAPS